jgi:hypothetical protein
MLNAGENISFILKDNDSTRVNENNENEIFSLMKELDTNANANTNMLLNNELNIYYNETYNVQQLLKICEYYGFLKYVKMAKYKKNDIIDAILLYEMDENNNKIVSKRQQLWAMMEELSNDKFMKKYILWN